MEDAVSSKGWKFWPILSSFLKVPFFLVGCLVILEITSVLIASKDLFHHSREKKKGLLLFWTVCRSVFKLGCTSIACCYLSPHRSQKFQISANWSRIATLAPLCSWICQMFTCLSAHHVRRHLCVPLACLMSDIFLPATPLLRVEFWVSGELDSSLNPSHLPANNHMWTGSWKLRHPAQYCAIFP